MRPQCDPKATSKPDAPGLGRGATAGIRLRVLGYWPERGAPFARHLRHSQDVVMEREEADEGNPPGAQGRGMPISARRWRSLLAYTGPTGWWPVWPCATRSWS